MSKVDYAEHELDRRFLAGLDEGELRAELAKRKKEESESINTGFRILFWVIMFIGCFIFPWVCIPIITIKLIVFVTKNEWEEYKQNPTAYWHACFPKLTLGQKVFWCSTIIFWTCAIFHELTK